MPFERDIYEKCRQIRNRETRSFWLAIIYVILVVLILILSWLRAFSAGLGFILIAALALTTIVVRGRRDYSRCPRCEKRFFFRWLAWSRTKDRCAHCGLPLDTRWNASKENAEVVRIWLAKPEPRGAIPTVGLHCPECEYELTGLTDRVCPECGRPFDPESLFKGALGSGRG